jgi:beta-galactosidase
MNSSQRFLRCAAFWLACGVIPLVRGAAVESFDAGWRFAKGDAVGADRTDFPDDGWRKLDLPHDWSIEGPYDEHAPTGGPGGYLPTGVGWYRKHFQVPANWQGRVVEIQFDGVYMNSEVWLNGHSLGRWPYGYSTFRYNLSPWLHYGSEPNVLAVRVDNSQQPNSRWYSGSGIYRHVWIRAADPLRIVTDGVTITTPEATSERGTAQIRVSLRNDRPQSQRVSVHSTLLDTAGNAVTGASSATVELEVPAATEAESEAVIHVQQPRLWSPDSPQLYRIRTELKLGEAMVDSIETTVGFRTIVYDVDRGFLLNGRPEKMLGMCLHHDAGAVGAAVPRAVLVRRLKLLKEMGCNAIRCSHNPPAPELLDLCDEMGFLVMDEAFDEWTVRKPQIKFGYSNYFEEWYERDLVAMIRRDRNHPSVVMWSAGNEIGEQRVPNGDAVLRKLVPVFHREDPTRPVTAAMDNIFTDKGPAPRAFTDLLDIAGYNYVDRWLDRRETYFGPDRSAYPGRRFVGTEDTGLGGVRSQYTFAPTAAGPRRRGPYYSAPIRVEQLWKFALTHDYVIGHFMWTGFDYLGESVWPSKGAASGALDTCGFPKDSYYFYQSVFLDRPMLHLLPHWTWPGRDGEITPVLAYTNCDRVELFLNGRSLGAKSREFPRQGTKGGWNTYAKPEVFPSTADLHLSWDVAYAPGVLRAVGYRDGKEVCSDEVRTAGAPHALHVSVDRPALEADGSDVAHVTVQVVDAAGVPVPDAENLVSFSVTGPAQLIGVDNGDLRSHADYKATQRSAFAGMCLALVQSTKSPGQIKIAASAEGLAPASVVVEAKPAASPARVITELP